ncbi:hypothetical protein F4777DRAFT_592163 [Nemania sp. FL0916]|nr:hypothetical protein F4777DRAFT_592163 [Nemania sp. FL0916]
MENSKQQRMQTIDKFLDGYGSLSVAKLLESLAPDYHHQILPESLQMPVRDIQDFAKHAEGIFGIFEEFKMIPKTTIDDASTGVVAIHAHMLGTLKGDKGEWKNECVLIVKLTQDGLKVADVREFVDSAKAMEMAQTHAPGTFGGRARDSPSTVFGCITFELSLTTQSSRQYRLLLISQWQRHFTVCGSRSGQACLSKKIFSS